MIRHQVCYTTYCDRCDKHLEDDQGLPRHFPDAVNALGGARDEGWAVADGRALCPACYGGSAAVTTAFLRSVGPDGSSDVPVEPGPSINRNRTIGPKPKPEPVEAEIQCGYPSPSHIIGQYRYCTRPEGHYIGWQPGMDTEMLDHYEEGEGIRHVWRTEGDQEGND